MTEELSLWVHSYELVRGDVIRLPCGTQTCNVYASFRVIEVLPNDDGTGRRLPPVIVLQPPLDIDAPIVRVDGVDAIAGMAGHGDAQLDVWFSRSAFAVVPDFRAVIRGTVAGKFRTIGDLVIASRFVVPRDRLIRTQAKPEPTAGASAAEWFPSPDLRVGDVVFLRCGSPAIERPFVVKRFGVWRSHDRTPFSHSLELDARGILDTQRAVKLDRFEGLEPLETLGSGNRVGVPLEIQRHPGLTEIVSIPAVVLRGPDLRWHVMGGPVTVPGPFIVPRSRVLLLGGLR